MLRKLPVRALKKVIRFSLPVLVLTLAAFLLSLVYYQNKPLIDYRLNLLFAGDSTLQKQLADTKNQLVLLQNEDQVKKNQALAEKIKNIETTYLASVNSYEKILSLKEKNQKTGELDKLFASSLSYLSKQQFASAAVDLVKIDKEIKEAETKLAANFTIPNNTTQSNSPPNVATSNNLPASGYQKQQVQAENGKYMVDIISADLNSTKVVVDTASSSDCTNDCPVMSLGDFISRNGAFAGVNGSFFCPTEYPSCAGKTNSFDTLLMNKDKKYFNSDNNVYSVIPAAIFGSGWARFVSRSLEWGRDTGVDAVIANYPLLLAGGQVVFGGNGEAKLSSKGARCFIASKDNFVYIGIVYNATSADAALVLKALGLHNALGLDQGGSTALMYGGRYLAGPGRNLPNAVLFVKR